ncbi:MAG: hypothetical protein KAI47_03845, partial [Deltaproteobacteria bacterium]|nr:hypothetical protein [Deltaproteobacteria bacterium]
LGVSLGLSLASTQAAAIPTINRDEIIDIAKSGVGSPYIWGGTCWDPKNRSWKGPDCSGYVTTCWQIPNASETTDCLPHYYTTSTFVNNTTHWTKISRDDLIRGDALVYNNGSYGHIILYDAGDKWGAAEVYEARGSAYGVVHRTKTVESKYVARRRDSLGATVPPTPTYPLMTITTTLASIAGQDKDFCKQGDSTSVFDLITGQTTELQVDITNSGTAKANGVEIGLWAEVPYLRVVHWNIFTNWKSTSFVLNDTDGLQSIGHDNPPQSFTLKLGGISAGETKRVVLAIRAGRFSIGAVDHPDIRAWVANVDDYYQKADFASAPNNVKSYQQQNGGDLRAAAETDVFGDEVCDNKDNNCDGQVDEGNICGTSPAPTSDASTPRADQGFSGPDAGSPSYPGPGQDSGAFPSNPGKQTTYDLVGGCNLAPGDSTPWPLSALGILLAFAALARLPRRHGR